MVEGKCFFIGLGYAQYWMPLHLNSQVSGYAQLKILHPPLTTPPLTTRPFFNIEKIFP